MGCSTRVPSAQRKELPYMKLSFTLACVFLTASIAAAQGDKAASPPPLIDRDVIFGNPEIAAAELSPDGKFVAFLKPCKATRTVYVKPVVDPFSNPRLLTTPTNHPPPAILLPHD